jgi:hypothetical protein
MKNLTYILFLISFVFFASCKKTKLTKNMENTSWELSQILIGSEDKTSEVLSTKILYTNLDYASEEGEIKFSNPTRQSVAKEEVGEWTIEKIVPTVGKSYYLVKNAMAFSQVREYVLNLHVYGSEVRLIETNQLTQTVGEYTIIYEKVN